MQQAGELRTLLAEVDPSWLDGLDPALFSRARESRLGRRMLARWLADGAGAALLAPAPQPALERVAKRWPRSKLESLLRNLGVLAFAPVIRAEVGREPVRRLKHALDKRYLLALDRKVWDGEVGHDTRTYLEASLASALDHPEPTPALLAMFARHGRAELRAWATPRDPLLAEWVALLHPRDPDPRAHLPVAAVQQLYSIHAGAA